jgi:hypothetical protein
MDFNSIIKPEVIAKGIEFCVCLAKKHKACNSWIRQWKAFDHLFSDDNLCVDSGLSQIIVSGSYKGCK